MTKRAMNVFEFIFGTFFILKVTKTGLVEDWNWFIVFLPLVINYIVKFFSWVVSTLGLGRSADVAIQNYYIGKVRDKAIEKAKKEIFGSIKK